MYDMHNTAGSVFGIIVHAWQVHEWYYDQLCATTYLSHFSGL